MGSLGRHLFGIAYVKVDVFPFQKMNVLLKIEELILNYLHVLYNVLGFVVIHIQNTLFETSLKKLTFKRGFKKCR